MLTITKKTTAPTTWAEILENKKTLAVGDEIAETLKTGEAVVFVVAGVGVYAEDEVIFSLKDCLSDRARMNEDWTNEGGWAACAMREHLNTTVFEMLPDDLQTIIVPRVIGEAADKLWLFSEREVFGDNDWTENDIDCGVQLPYYKNKGNRIKGLGKDGSASNWWERSPAASNSAGFCYVNSGGGAASANASGSRGVCFGFRI